MAVVKPAVIVAGLNRIATLLLKYLILTTTATSCSKQKPCLVTILEDRFQRKMPFSVASPFAPDYAYTVELDENSGDE